MVKRPDLVIEAVTVNTSIVSSGGPFTLLATVSNAGNGDATNTTLRYYESTDSIIGTMDKQVGTYPVDPLSNDASGRGSITISFPSSGNNFFYYGACVDSVDGESTTDNNCSTSTGVLVRRQSFTLSDGNGNTLGYAFGMAYYNDALWVTDVDDDKVYKYSTGGVYQSSFDLGSCFLVNVNNPSGITEHNGFFWIVDNNHDSVFKYSTSGTCQSSGAFSLRVSGTSSNPFVYSITEYNGNFWIVDNRDDEVHRFSTSGNYDTSFSLTSANASSRDITFYDNAFWVVDWDDDKVYKYTTSFSRQSSGDFDLIDGNDEPSSIVYYSNAFWVVDRVDGKVYLYEAP